MPSLSLESSVVAILDAQHNVKGTGFVAGERLILTCAHVVELAGSGLNGSVFIRFHHNREQRTATVSHLDANNDLAVLRLTDDLPLGVTRLRLGDAIETTDQSFRTFGYPNLGIEGSHAEGPILGETRGKDDQKLLQLKSSQLAQGFSGGPLMVNDRVIGVVTAVYHTDQTLKNFDTAWGIPIELARTLYPELAAPALWPLGHSYAESPNFTGRQPERAALSAWLESGPTVMVLRAHGGFGKSALVWDWLQKDVDPLRWPRTFWWNFYDESAFERFLENALPHFDIDPTKLGARLQADALLEKLTEPGVLLVLDGFERTLRAFRGMDAAYQGDEEEEIASRAEPDDNSLTQRDCLSLVAEELLRSAASRAGLRGRVLITTRLRPRVLEGHDGLPLRYCRTIDLNELSPTDAVAFFQAQQIQGTRAEIEAACSPYGYHPLSLRLLAGMIVSDLRQPGDIAVAQRLDVSGDLKQRRHHVLEQAYNSLTPTRQQLLSRIACFRGAVNYEALQATVGKASTNKRARHRRKASHHLSDTNSDLLDLIARGLLRRNSSAQRFDLHPIVRRYTYDQLTDKDKTAVHSRLRDYFAAIEAPAKPRTLDDLAPLIECYHHTVSAGQYDEAMKLYYEHLAYTIYFQFGEYQLQIDLLRTLFPDGEDRPPRLKEDYQAWTLNTLANSYGQIGQPRRAIPLFEQAIVIVENQNKKKKNLAIGLGNLASEQIRTGVLRPAEANLRRSITLSHEIEDELDEAVGFQELGRLLAYRGDREQSAAELSTAIKTFEKQKQAQPQGIVWAYRAIRELLLARTSPPLPGPPLLGSSPMGEGQGGGEALATARRALELADETTRTRYPQEHDYVRAHWLLGAAHRVAGNHAEAERHLNEALTRCRGINAVEAETDILIDLARLRAVMNEPEEATRLAEEALRITERCGYVLQGADAHLELAKLALARNDKNLARDHARAAHTLATCDGPPDYTYKVAYQEAEEILRELGGNEGT